MEASLQQKAAFEFGGTLFLIIAVVGSGIAAERLSGGNAAVALLVNALVTGFALFGIILAVAPVSGAHLNPAVTLAAMLLDKFTQAHVPVYIIAQVAGALCGVFITHAMFEVPLFQISHHARDGLGVWISEAVATFGLVLLIWRCRIYQVPVVAGAVAAYIAGAYWFTASTAFANPAVTLARSFTDTFAGIEPSNVVAFIVAQLIGAASAAALIRLQK